MATDATQNGEQVLARELEISDKPLETVAAIVKRITGYEPDPSVVSRWARVGVRGVTLPTCRIGNRTMTTEDAFRQFIRDQSTATSSRNGG